MFKNDNYSTDKSRSLIYTKNPAYNHKPQHSLHAQTAINLILQPHAQTAFTLLQLLPYLTIVITVYLTQATVNHIIIVITEL